MNRAISSVVVVPILPRQMNNTERVSVCKRERNRPWTTYIKYFRRISFNVAVCFNLTRSKRFRFEYTSNAHTHTNILIGCDFPHIFKCRLASTSHFPPSILFIRLSFQVLYSFFLLLVATIFSLHKQLVFTHIDMNYASQFSCIKLKIQLRKKTTTTDTNWTKFELKCSKMWERLTWELALYLRERGGGGGAG